MPVAKTSMIISSDNIYNVKGVKWENVIETIAINPFDKKPYLRIKRPLAEGLGSIVDIYPDRWEKVNEYSEHMYDYVVVSGVRGAEVLVYGNKIGKKVINIETPLNATSWATFDIRPDNKLLVRKFAENSYQIVHNITQLVREYEMEQHGPKIK